VALTLVPQSLAYADLAGLPKEYGLYSAYIGCFAYALFGSVKVNERRLLQRRPPCVRARDTRSPCLLRALPAERLRRMSP